jgi:carbamoyltransferase
MTILGLHTGHDGAACIVKNGRLVAALGSERISRAKRSAGAPEAVQDAVLEAAGVTLDKVDAIAVTDWYETWANCDMQCYAVDDVPTDIDGKPHKPGDRVADTWNRVFDDNVYRLDVVLRGQKFPGYNIGHQKAHCAAAFYTSPFQDAWCFSMDSSGALPKNNCMTARGSGNALNWHDAELCMVGMAYGMVCEKLGIGHQMHKAGSMMALAAYGTPMQRFRDRIDYHRKKAHYKQDRNTWQEYGTWLIAIWDELRQDQTFTHETSDSQPARDIAATMQYLFEEAIIESLERIPDDGCNNLCLGGGSFLNCNVNRLIRERTRFKNVHLFPACTDDGLAVGGALYTSHAILGEKRKDYAPKDLAYLGPKRAAGPAPPYERIAQAIADGAIVAWFQGRSEYGPRALGNRSILADPRKAENRERINHELKHREWYRPLAPSVLAEKSQEWFSFDAPSPFMLFTAHCPRAAEIPAACHIDGTARMQTVAQSDNPRFYRLIQAFEKITGVPILLNTSLNVDGQPIVETEAEALEFFEKVPVDMAVINGKVVLRK